MTTIGCRTRSLGLAIAAGLALGTPGAAYAELDIFLKISGLVGESQDARHRDEIDVLSFTETVVGRTCSRFTIVKNVDRATPGLTDAASDGRHFQSATLVVRTAGRDPVEFYVVTMQELTVLSAEQVADSAMVRPTEKVVLVPRMARMRYVPQRANGAPGAAVESTLTCQ
jgi:type VI secretion system secreted protein Hcp